MEFPAIEEFVNDMVNNALAQAREEERKAREEERKAREKAERKAQEEQKETIILLEMKFGSKALHLLKKIGKIEDSEELTLLKQTIRMSKDIKEIEEYLEDIARS